MQIRYEWRGDVGNNALNRLHAAGFDHPIYEDDWRTQLAEHSLGWVCAYVGQELVGFVNVAWDGAFHAFILDTVVAMEHRRQGIGRELVAIAAAEARRTGCEWLHVDFDPEYRAFYFDGCGFDPTDAGLIAL
jgi:ribosomal protein S18 acetylase RimI-like enzyme